MFLSSRPIAVVHRGVPPDMQQRTETVHGT